MSDKIKQWQAVSADPEEALNAIERHCEEMPEVQALYNLRHQSAAKDARIRELEGQLADAKEQYEALSIGKDAWEADARRYCSNSTFWMERADAAEQRLKEVYHAGFCDGLTAYAIWRDGKQWVGDPGRSLAEAKEKAESTWNYKA